MDPILDLQQFVVFLSLGGAAVAAQALASIVLEKLGWFQALASGQRLALTAGLAAALGLGATAILAFVPAAALAALQPYFLALVLAVGPFIGGEVAHRALRRPSV